MRYRYRWMPFDSCDLVEIESWLSRCAARGLRLCSCTGNFARFEKVAPFQARYRLDPIQPRPIPPQPDADMLALYASDGWKFAAEFGEFYIFCATDPQAPELHTDPALLAYALRRQVRSSAINALLLTLVVTALGFWLVYRLLRDGKPLLELMESGTLPFLYVAGILVLLVAADLVQAVRVLRLWHALRRGQTPERGCSYRRAMIRHAATLVLAFLAICTSFISAGLKPRSEVYPCADYPGALPFPLLAEMEASADFQYDSFVNEGTDWANYAERSRDLLAPCILTAKQYGLSGPNAESWDRYLYVQYYDCRTERLSREVLQELKTEAVQGRDSAVQTLTLHGMDEAYFYEETLEDHWFDDATGDLYRQSTDHFQYLFLRAGTRAVKICYAGAQPLEELVPRFAELLLTAAP